MPKAKRAEAQKIPVAKPAGDGDERAFQAFLVASLISLAVLTILVIVAR